MSFGQKWMELWQTSTYFSSLGRSSYFGLSLNSHVYWHCMKQPIAWQRGNGLGRLSGREQIWPYMVKSAVSRTQQQKRQRQTQVSSIEILKHTLTEGEIKNIMQTKCILCVESNWCMWDWAETEQNTMSLCTHQGFTNSKGWALDDWIQIKHTHTPDHSVGAEAEFEHGFDIG